MPLDIYKLIDESKIIFKNMKKGKYLVQATVNVGGLGLEIRSFLIGKNEETGQIWCMPPFWGRPGNKNSRSNANYYVFIDDREAWNYFVAKIINEYHKYCRSPVDGMMSSSEADQLVEDISGII